MQICLDLLNSIDLGVIKTDIHENVIYINQFLSNYFSKSVKTIDEIIHFFVHSNDKTQLKIPPGEDTLVQMLSQNGAYRTFKVEKRILPTEEDGVIHFLWLFYDVQEQKKLEQLLLKERLRLEEAYKHKSNFLANITHEIRTPINGIVGMIALMGDTQLTEEQTSYLEMVKECSFNLMSIINDILDYSKLEAGKLVIDAKCMSLRKCIESTNDIILSKSYEKEVEYTYDVDSRIPELIKGDMNRIKQIILNLLSNAFKFTDHGSIHLQVDKITKEEFKNEVINNNDLFLKFSITDTGCGISKDDTSKLFQSFSQINNGTSTKLYGGTGLGLAICKELVTLMNGNIYLDKSVLNEGSTFSFTIQTKSCVSENEKIKDTILQNLNILIVDDNLQNRMSLTAMVTKWGMKAHVFSNSQEALFYTKFQTFDMGLIDICMPRMDGKMLVQKLSSQLKDNMFPVIGLSSLGDKLKDSNLFHTILLKPVKESKLKELCMELILKKEETSIASTSKSISNDTNSLPIIDIYSEIKPNVRLLVAEDVYINQCVLINFLKKLGYLNVDLVSNGIDCISKLEENEYDVLLLDIRMPGMNGDEIIKEIEKYYSKKEKSDYHFKNSQKPFSIAITAYCLKDDKEKYLTMGFDEYISKPIDINKLKISLDNAMEHIMMQ
jgi:signal transduction histidine kinase/PleD family two-component response regulator